MAQPDDGRWRNKADAIADGRKDRRHVVIRRTMAASSTGISVRVDNKNERSGQGEGADGGRRKGGQACNSLLSAVRSVKKPGPLLQKMKGGANSVLFAYLAFVFLRGTFSNKRNVLALFSRSLQRNPRMPHSSIKHCWIRREPSERARAGCSLTLRQGMAP